MSLADNIGTRFCLCHRHFESISTVSSFYDFAVSHQPIVVHLLYGSMATSVIITASGVFYFAQVESKVLLLRDSVAFYLSVYHLARENVKRGDAEFQTRFFFQKQIGLNWYMPGMEPTSIFCFCPQLKQWENKVVY